MKRVTLRMPAEQVQRLEALVATGEYPNRSEALRAAVRELTADEFDRSRHHPLANGGDDGRWSR